MRHFRLSPIAIMILILVVVPLVGCTPTSGDEDWESKYETLKIENIVLKADMETTQADVAYLESALEISKAEYDTLNTKYGTLQAISKKLQADYDVIQTSYNALRTDYTTLKANDDTLQADYDMLKTDFILYDTALAAQIADYNSLKANYDTLQALYNDVSNKLAEAGTPSLPVSTPTIIESYIDGTFEGWDGDTLFKLRNGQIWEQASYNYIYHYAYSPEVLIYSTTGGYKMIVNGVSATIYVRRLK